MAHDMVNSAKGMTCDWSDLVQELPKNPLAHLGAVVTLRKLGLTSDAESMAKASSDLFPQSVQLAFEFCRAADRREAWTDSVERWSVARQAFAGHPATAIGLSIALQKLGRLDDAEAVLTTAMERFGSNIDDTVWDAWIKGVAVQSARCATSREDWPVAIDRWKRLHARFPAEEGIKNLFKDAVMNKILVEAQCAAEQEGGHLTAQKRNALARLCQDESSSPLQQNLMLEFVSLGGSCEFGLLQRHFGVEPPGLLRWGNIDLDMLIAMLKTECAGVGDAKNLELSVNRAQEYLITDKRFAMTLHTFTHRAGQDESKLISYLSLRLRFLRQLLLDDLVSAERIFVYRSMSGITEDDMLALSEAIRAFNTRNSVLCVTIPESAEKPGGVKKLSEHLACASLLPGRSPPPELAWKIQYQAWAEICAAAFDSLRSTV